ncbi:enoyl-CoA hydratase [Zhengella mangrovi]|uniref:Enoyl-CoA hydratase n=1 Tax=Zhengella mangrovi TaxID=1982044 RepID=A0A2G1QKB7_9HYPH|nr:enoyl-CoA hydratase-related protein [Zhengella mangrovi]PHP65942.1 enoyl-CoA hydratase [Zhengella mangrovi]
MSGFPETVTLDLEPDGGWLTVWFNEPERRNPLSPARAADLLALAGALENRRDIRGLTFRGRDAMFSAGADLAALKRLGQAGRDEIEALSREGARMYRALADLPQFTVAVIEGAAMGGGLGLACTADLVIATPDARLALSEARVGLVAAQIAPFVVARAGMTAARRLMLTGEAMDATAACAAGLVDRVVPAAAIEAEIGGLRAKLRKAAPEAVVATKRLLQGLPALSAAQAVDAAAKTFADAILSDDGREGMASFFDKRPAGWTAKPC